MTRSTINDPEHWRKRGDEMRALALEMVDSKAKRIMLKLAAEYERLMKKRAEESLGRNRITRRK